VLYLPYEHLVFGAGGGGGAGHVDVGTAGAPGGGVMIIRAGEAAGAGLFSAMGASADFVPSSFDDGAGGGGAGGAISVRTTRGLTCGLAQAAGGTGGDTHHPSNPSGPGGGGGGGIVFLQGESLTCPVSVVAGDPGQSTAAGGSFGAGPVIVNKGASYGSAQTYPMPFRVLDTPALTQPPDGASGLPLRPLIEGSSEPGVVIHLFLDGVPYAQVVSSSTGAFSYAPPLDLTVGSHELQASAEMFGAYSLPSGLNRFDVVTTGDGGVPDGGFSEEQPILVVPREGEAVGSEPLFAGTSLRGASVSIEVDGAEVARLPLDEQRRFSYTLIAEQRLVPGAHHAVARAWDEQESEGLSSATTSFEVKSPMALDVGCGCGASPGAGLGAMALLLGLGAARLRRRE
jgi:MYXO-CTERM domain-containing protein